MGILDDFIKGASDIVNEVKNTIKEEQGKIKEKQSEPVSKGDDMLDHPSEALPAIPISANLRGHNVNLMISQDFIKDAGYATSVASFKYNPNEINFNMDCTISLNEGIGEFDEIADCIEQYLSNKTISGVDEFTEFADGQYLFKAKMDSSDDVDYFYVLRNNFTDPYDYDFLLLFYPRDVKNTMLEKKLISCFEETARNFTILD